MRPKKTSVFKTLSRRLQLVKVKSRKYKKGTSVATVKATKQNQFAHIRISKSKYVKLERCYIPICLNNKYVLEFCGYTPRQTKTKKNALRVVPRNICVDGWTCRERRLVLLTQRKLQNAA